MFLFYFDFKNIHNSKRVHNIQLLNNSRAAINNNFNVLPILITHLTNFME